MKTAAELRVELAAAEEVEKAELASKMKAREEAWKKVLAGSPWEVRVLPQVSTLWGKPETKVNFLNISRRIAPWIADQFKAEWGRIPDDDKMMEWHGMSYYRTSEGILTNNGGGWNILNVPMLCNDEEWEMMKNVMIPAKYRNWNLK